MHPPRMIRIKDEPAPAKRNRMPGCAGEMMSILQAHRKRYPLMTEEDAVKLVFQGMLGVGHLISSEQDALGRLRAEMSALEPDGDEPLTERVSPQWFRLNLRAAKAHGLTEADIAHMLCESAKKKPLPFTRQNVYNICVRLDGSEAMRAAAGKVLDEAYLPSHSRQYRRAYHPAYRVLHEDFRNLPGMAEELKTNPPTRTALPGGEQIRSKDPEGDIWKEQKQEN